MAHAPIPNVLGIHALVWVGGWSEQEARTAIASTKQAGFDLIELTAMDPATLDAGPTARLLAEHGVTAAVSMGLGEDTDVSSEDPESVKRGRALLLDGYASHGTLAAPTSAA